MRAAALLVVSGWMFLTVFAGPVLATHKDGHQRTPACENAQGQAPAKNKHCYPPNTSTPNQTGSIPSFTSPGSKGEGGGGTIPFSVGFLASSTAGLVTVGLLGRWLWLQHHVRASTA